MQNSKEVRWQQRFVNFSKALLQLEKALERKELSDLEEEQSCSRAVVGVQEGDVSMRDGHGAADVHTTDNSIA